MTTRKLKVGDLITITKKINIGGPDGETYETKTNGTIIAVRDDGSTIIATGLMERDTFNVPNLVEKTVVEFDDGTTARHLKWRLDPPATML